jgi:hypothetical protein
MAARIGEYLKEGYIKHPAPSNWLANGESLDAGSMMIIDSNISWLQRESVRHLVTQVGPGLVTKYEAAVNVYEGIEGITAPPSGLTFIDHERIPWTRETTRRYGPFPVICDEKDSTGEAIPRAIRVHLLMTYTTSDTNVYLALTTTPDRAAPYNGDYLAFAMTPPATQPTTQTFTLGASGTVTTATLAVANPVPRTNHELWHSRRVTSAPTQYRSITRVLDCYLFIGVRAVDAGAAACSIDSVSVFEVRP